MTSEEIQSKYSLEYWDEGGYQGLEEKEISKMLIEFAQYHVQEALKAKSKAMKKEKEQDSSFSMDEIDAFTKDAYPLKNIK